MSEIEYLEFENMRTNANVSTFQKETFWQANFGVNIHRDIIDGRPGKRVYHINVAGIRFAILEDSAHSIISEIQRLGLSKERDKTELIEERKIDKKYISFTKIGRIIEDIGCSFPLGISVFSKINKLGFYGEEAEALLDKTLQILNANPSLTFKEAFEKGYTMEDFKAATEVLKRMDIEKAKAEFITDMVKNMSWSIEDLEGAAEILKRKCPWKKQKQKGKHVKKRMKEQLLCDYGNTASEMTPTEAIKIIEEWKEEMKAIDEIKIERADFNDFQRLWGKMNGVFYFKEFCGPELRERYWEFLFRKNLRENSKWVLVQHYTEKLIEAHWINIKGKER